MVTPFDLLLIYPRDIIKNSDGHLNLNSVLFDKIKIHR